MAEQHDDGLLADRHAASTFRAYSTVGMPGMPLRLLDVISVTQK
ncbi:hypothetical protein ACFU6I_29105 [Streptomyces sp. NPDC057486]